MVTLPTLASAGTAAQQPQPYPDTVASNLPKPEKVKLYNSVPGIVEPVLLPEQFPPLSSKCHGSKDSGTVTFSFVVDANGEPRNAVFKRALANAIDLLALQLLLMARFQPATSSGAAVAFGRDVEMHLEVCNEKQPATGQGVARLRSAPELKFSNWRRAPEQANLAPAHKPDDAQGDHERPGSDFTLPRVIARYMPDSHGMSGSFEFGVRADEHGIDHIEKVLKSTNPALLPVATAFILSIRQTPAMKDGMPVPVHFTANVDINSH